jgi:hypothetical protein
MTPKEKAIQLLEAAETDLLRASAWSSWAHVKVEAKNKCTDAIVKYEKFKAFVNNDGNNARIEYWNEVLQEIDKF